ncbi:amino acid transporter [Rhizobium sp. T1470]|uniref:nucleotidyltransferase domain-containing protein n=1 Tax=unclassified Rhizobium TaxID=2613769 RepID=UPI001AAFF0C6|nr:amino acid transporter [Rhizobium sp. T1473]MCA0803228.1 amino acid transporter [Rhizobium sp. T1473]
MQSQMPIDHGAWPAWHPAELAARLSAVSRRWCIVGGWALDLWHGHQTREHEDLEFTILRQDFGIFRDALKGMEFDTAGDGVVEYLPADEEPPAAISQIWCLDMEERRWRVDMMIEPGTLDTWIYKRQPAISRPRDEMVDTTAEGIPYLKPAAVLLFKAKYGRPKDEIDFERALPRLPVSERRWLKTSLAACHPGHEWLKGLQEPPMTLAQ